MRKLRDGPNIASYRGLKIINSRSFSMEEGAPPRDVLRRRVRVAEYYRIPYEQDIEQKSFAFYDESKVGFRFRVNTYFLSSINLTKLASGRLAKVLLERPIQDVADWRNQRG